MSRVVLYFRQSLHIAHYGLLRQNTKPADVEERDMGSRHASSVWNVDIVYLSPT